MFHILFFVYIFLCAYSLAKLEINIEGKYGWAEKLPTWRKVINLPIFNKKEMTGYHFHFFILLLPLLVHLPFLFSSWNLLTELRIISFYLLMVGFEDILWFVFNPHYGILKYNSKYVTWHKIWLLGLPIEIFICLTAGITIYLLTIIFY